MPIRNLTLRETALTGLINCACDCGCNLYTTLLKKLDGTVYQDTSCLFCMTGQHKREEKEKRER